MNATRWPIAAALALATIAAAARAEAQSTQYVDENGIRYQVTRSVVPRSIAVTKTEDRQVTTYRQQVTTENVPYQQVYNVPVTQYQVVSRLHGRWNPFVTPYWTYEYEPVTVWQQQVATVQIPVARSTWTPETKTVQQPVTKWETHQQEIVMKTPIGPTPTGATPLPGGSSTALAARPLTPATASAALSAAPTTATPAAPPATAIASQQYGGQMLQSDPPRTSGWQPPPDSSVPATAASNNAPRY
ncbi:MAG: hypothetical protein IT424_06250 [Pirellulales bacterium]|nr:hypothetical protein [Pirellulales bacterium]